MRHTLLLIICLLIEIGHTHAQVGEHRSDLAIGVNAGYVLSRVGFTPSVSQKFHGGVTAGLTFRYVCEKYFKTICSIVAECNYAAIGWNEDILDLYEQPVINTITGKAETYKRNLNYLQIPIFAHLAWGKEQRGWQFFAQAGPQFGLLLSENTSTNFDLSTVNIEQRSNKTIAQDSIKVQNSFDYGIAAGIGAEYSLPKIGHLQIEARYYFGLGNIFKDSKNDYFGKSNFGNIVFKLAWLFDLKKRRD